MKWILLGIVVVTTVLADLLQSHEMKIAAAEKGNTFGFPALLKALATRPNLILAIAALALSFFAFLALVQTQPLSFAVPASAASFVVETVLAKLVLKERVDARRAAGALLVFSGIVLLGR
jgi:drug/metabolite transporter (DMT)-like permease